MKILRGCLIKKPYKSSELKKNIAKKSGIKTNS